MRALVPLIGALAVGSASCKASVNAEANVSTGGNDDEVADFDEPLEEPIDTTAPEFQDEPAKPDALLGARQDLSFNGDPSAKCSCLAVALGQAGDPIFDWATKTPTTNPETQLVIAVSSGGISCADAPDDSLGASYWGYENVGSDVIVVVESARPGRPSTAGAIIPKPFGDGNVYVRPRDAKTPYGRPLDGADKKCKIGNPGATREGTGSDTGDSDDDFASDPTSADQSDSEL